MKEPNELFLELIAEFNLEDNNDKIDITTTSEYLSLTGPSR